MYNFNIMYATYTARHAKHHIFPPFRGRVKLAKQIFDYLCLSGYWHWCWYWGIVLENDISLRVTDGIHNYLIVSCRINGTCNARKNSCYLKPVLGIDYKCCEIRYNHSNLTKNAVSYRYLAKHLVSRY